MPETIYPPFSPASSSGEESSDGDPVDSISFASREDEPIMEEDLLRQQWRRVGRNRPFRRRRSLHQIASTKLYLMFRSSTPVSGEIKSIIDEYENWHWHEPGVDRSSMARFNDTGVAVTRIDRKLFHKRTSLLTIRLDNLHLVQDLVGRHFRRFTHFLTTGVAYTAEEYALIRGGDSAGLFEPPKYRKRAHLVLHQLVALIWTSYYMAKYQYLCNVEKLFSHQTDMRGRRRTFLDWYRRAAGRRLPTGTAWLIMIHAWTQKVSGLANGIKRWRRATTWAYTDRHIRRIMQEVSSIRGLLEDFVTPTRRAYCAQMDEGLLLQKQKALRDKLEFLIGFWATDMRVEMEVQILERKFHAYPSTSLSSPSGTRGEAGSPPLHIPTPMPCAGNPGSPSDPSGNIHCDSPTPNSPPLLLKASLSTLNLTNNYGLVSQSDSHV